MPHIWSEMTRAEKDAHNKRRREKYQMDKQAGKIKSKPRKPVVLYAEGVRKMIQELVLQRVPNIEVTRRVRQTFPEETKHLSKYLISASCSYWKKKYGLQHKKGEQQAARSNNYPPLLNKLDKLLTKPKSFNNGRTKLLSLVEQIKDNLNEIQELGIEFGDLEGAKTALRLKKEIISAFIS